MRVSLEARFPESPSSIVAARRFVNAALRDVDEVSRERAELMVSELATNAVRHARSAFRISVELDHDVVRVEVSDTGTGHPHRRRPAPDEPTGRGLLIVDSMSDGWGVVEHDEGKAVWFSLAARSSADSTGRAGRRR